MRKLLAGTLLVVTLAFAGCGGSSPSGTNTNASDNGEAAKSAQQVLTDAVTAAKAASSFRMSGQIATGGQQIGIDMTIAKGKGATGSMTLKGQKVDLVIVGTNGYMKAGTAFWTQFGGSAGGAIAQLVADKWMKFPTSNAQFGQLTGIASSSIFDQLSTNHGAITNKGATTYKGQSVVDLFDGSKLGHLYIAATGTAYPVAIAKSGAGDGGTITFDSWNMSVTVTAPSGAVDISKLGG